MRVCSVVSDSETPWTAGFSTSLLCPWDSPGKNTGVGSHFLLQEIFPTQGSNPIFLYWQADSYPWATWEANQRRQEKRKICAVFLKEVCRILKTVAELQTHLTDSSLHSSPYLKHGGRRGWLSNRQQGYKFQPGSGKHGTSPTSLQIPKV